MESPETRYTVYIRLPFPRGDFVDPPPVNWDSSKDEALWNILSGVSKTEIEWDVIAAKFEVTVDFLLQQVTYLTDRHASQVRAQMRKATAAKGSAAPSPVPTGSESAAAAAVDMRRTGSGGAGPGRAPSALSIRKDSPLPRNEGPAMKPAPFARPPVSRAASSNAVGSAAAGGQRTAPGGGGSSTPRTGETASQQQQQRRRLSSLPIGAAAAGAPSPRPSSDHTIKLDVEDADSEDAPQSPGPAESSSSSSSASSSPAQSRIIRRPPRFQASNPSGLGAAGEDGAGPAAVDDDDDDDAEPAFLPFRADGQYSDPSATLRGDPREHQRSAAKQRQQHRELLAAASSQHSDSSTGSAAVIHHHHHLSSPARGAGNSGPLSPRRTAELSGRSPSAGGSKGKGYSRDGSDGTPSMGSSFSDLDDASVTQSALEEALASRMQDGTIGSRMSTIGQAFRSRYLPKANQPPSEGR